MALLSFSQEPSKSTKKQPSSENKKQPSKRKKKQQKQTSSSSSWDQIKNLLTCKQIDHHHQHQTNVHNSPSLSKNNSSKLVGSSSSSSCSSICTFRDVVHGNTRVVHRADNSPDETKLLSKKNSNKNGGSSSSNNSSRSMASSIRSSSSGGHHGTYSSSGGGGRGGSSRGGGMQFRKLSGCYECHMIVDPSRYPLPRTTICACPECGEVFPKIESLEHHQAVRHAVSELGPDDSSRNIVEIIFKSSWLKKDNPICKIERILKVHNTQKTIQRFEDCREAVKIRANSNTKKNARCAADGNELLRFHCTTLTCSLGARGSTSLCGSSPGCEVCTIIRNGFQGNKLSGVRTTASSGRAHDCLNSTDGRRAMLVCRVIAGRVKSMMNDAEAEENTDPSVSASSYDSIAGYASVYSNLEELNVFNPRAILPCFVVIYKALES